MDLSNLFEIDNMRFQFIIGTTVSFYLIGGFGNILSMVIFNNKLFRSQPTTGYIQSFFVINIVTIIYIPIMFLTPIWISSSFSCKFFIGVFLILLEIQAWVTAISSLDRLITVLQPYNYLFKNKFKFQIAVVILIILIVTVLISPAFIYMDAVNFGNQSLCFYTELWSAFYMKYQYLFFRVTLPFVVMIISSVIITWKMYRMKARLSSNTSREKEANLFKALIFSDIFFILFRLPMLFYIILYQNGPYLIYEFQYNIFLAVGLMNNVLIFLLLLIFNKIYRKLFVKYMCCKKDLAQSSAHVVVALKHIKKRDDEFENNYHA